MNVWIYLWVQTLSTPSLRCKHEASFFLIDLLFAFSGFYFVWLTTRLLLWSFLMDRWCWMRKNRRCCVWDGCSYFLALAFLVLSLCSSVFSPFLALFTFFPILISEWLPKKWFVVGVSWIYFLSFSSILFLKNVLGRNFQQNQQ